MSASSEAVAARTGVLIAGVDEAGRGPLAGPVIAAAVILPDGFKPDELTDSKKLSSRMRDRLYLEIMGHCWVGVGGATVEEIDRVNILEATMLAMARAVDGLPVLPARALIDGNRAPLLPCAAQAIVKGDLTVPAISAASVVAKVARDRIMGSLSYKWPGYGLETNQGYPSANHKKALSELGVTPLHRRSFAPVHKILGEKHRLKH